MIARLIDRFMKWLNDWPEKTATSSSSFRSVSVNGCNTIVQKNNRTYVNGKLVSSTGEPAEIIVNGDVGSLQCNTATINGNVKKDVQTNTVKCRDVGGDVNANTVRCGKINGNVEANTVRHE